jgi:hypothetical protein
VARAMNQQSAKRQVHTFFPDFLDQRAEIIPLDAWARGEQESTLYTPKHYNTNDEYQDLMERSPTPWLGLGITSVAQTCYVDGIRRRGSNDVLQAYETWQQNRWDSRQNALYRATMAHGLAYASAMPGTIPLTGEKSAVMRGYSALTTAAWYEYVDDEWPMFVIHAEQELTDDGQPGWAVELTDEVAVYRFHCKGDGENLNDWEYDTTEEHDLGVAPFVRYTNQTDLDGRHTSEIEPFIPLAKRIDQDAFDRLIVQRFGAWKIRFITGLQRPKEVSEEKFQADLTKLKINDFLVGGEGTQFGVLSETQLDGFIKARDSDLRDLSAVLQVPPYMFLGLSANMQAESLSAARSALMAKSAERRTGWGEDHEQLMRLTAKIRGNREEMTAYDMEVRWRDTEVRPLIQAAQALGNLASQVGVPLEMLWSMIPGWTDSDVERAKTLVESGGFDQLVREFEAQMGNTGAPGSTTPPTGAPSAPGVTKVP